MLKRIVAVIMFAVSLVLIVASQPRIASADESTRLAQVAEPIPLSCEQDQGEKACCPGYCAGKKTDGWYAAEQRFRKCVVGYGCSDSDATTMVAHCGGWYCKD